MNSVRSTLEQLRAALVKEIPTRPKVRIIDMTQPHPAPSAPRDGVIVKNFSHGAPD